MSADPHAPGAAPSGLDRGDIGESTRRTLEGDECRRFCEDIARAVDDASGLFDVEPRCDGAEERAGAGAAVPADELRLQVASARRLLGRLAKALERVDELVSDALDDRRPGPPA